MSDNNHSSNLHHRLQIINEEHMTELGAALAKWVKLGTIIYLDGDLGAGKTTLVRGFLRAAGHYGAVKSPTFTLVESYFLDNEIFLNYNKLELELKLNNHDKLLTKPGEPRGATLNEVKVYHFDLYRLADPEELEYMGIRDYLDGQAITLIEWPEKGYGVLPEADLVIKIRHQHKGREVDLLPQSEDGMLLVSKLTVKAKK